MNSKHRKRDFERKEFLAISADLGEIDGIGVKREIVSRRCREVWRKFAAKFGTIKTDQITLTTDTIKMPKALKSAKSSLRVKSPF